MRLSYHSRKILWPVFSCRYYKLIIHMLLISVIYVVKQNLFLIPRIIRIKLITLIFKKPSGGGEILLYDQKDTGRLPGFGFGKYRQNSLLH